MGRLAAAKLFPLSAGFHNVTGLELDGEPVEMHGYFPDPVPYQSLIKLRELHTLTSDEFSKLRDAAYGFVRYGGSYCSPAQSVLPVPSEALKPHGCNSSGLQPD